MNSQLHLRRKLMSALCDALFIMDAIDLSVAPSQGHISSRVNAEMMAVVEILLRYVFITLIN